MLKPKSKTKFFLPISSCIPSLYLPIVTSTSHQSQTIFILFTFYSLSPNSHHTFIYSLFLLLPFVSTSCYHLRFVLLSSQDCISCCRSRFIVSFLSIFFFYFFLPSLFFPKISLLRYEKFSVFTFWPGWNETIFKTLVHAVLELCRHLVGEAKKRKEKKRHRSDTSTSVMRKHSSSSTSSGHRPLF